MSVQPNEPPPQGPPSPQPLEGALPMASGTGCSGEGAASAIQEWLRQSQERSWRWKDLDATEEAPGPE